MNAHVLNLKNVDMLCPKCVMNVVRVLSHLDGILGLNVSLEEKRVRIIYDNEKYSRKRIEDIINQSIIHGKVNKDFLNL